MVALIQKSKYFDRIEDNSNDQNIMQSIADLSEIVLRPKFAALIE